MVGKEEEEEENPAVEEVGGFRARIGGHPG